MFVYNSISELRQNLVTLQSTLASITVSTNLFTLGNTSLQLWREIIDVIASNLAQVSNFGYTDIQIVSKTSMTYSILFCEITHIKKSMKNKNLNKLLKKIWDDFT